MLAFAAANTQARGDEPVLTTYGPFAVRSEGTGQMSSDAYRVNVVTTRVLQATYLAPRQHCSSVKIHFLVDGRERAVSEAVAPGARSGYFDLGPVSAGAHELAAQAEGVPGGCNQGRLSAWQGSISVWTSATSADEETAGAGLGSLALEAGLVNYAWGYVSRGCYIGADGAIYAYHYDRGDALAPGPDAQGLYGEGDLLEKFSHNRTRQGRIPAEELAGKADAIARAASGTFAESPQHGADQGEHIFTAYLRIAGSNRFRPVLLGESGDVTRINLAPAAQELTDWLRGVLLRNGCTP
jgi:hypothetical protein